MIRLFVCICYSFILFVFLNTVGVFAQGMPADPRPIKVKQPDGSFINVVGKGNTYISYTETIDGYTLAKNKKGIYEYAVSDTTGNLVPSGIKAHEPGRRGKKERRFLKKALPHLTYTGKKLEELKTQMKANPKLM